MPVGALKIDTSVNVDRSISSVKTVQNNLNFTVHANNNYTGKFKAKNAKNYTILSKPKHGQLVLKKGEFVYKPNKNFVGLDTFQYKFYDGKKYSDTYTVKICVTNNPPVTKNISTKTHTNVKYINELKGEDLDRDPLTYKLVSNSKNGTTTLNSNGVYSYTPNTNFMGVDSFSYKVNDGISDSQVSTVTINVNNYPPIVNDTNVELHSNLKYNGEVKGTDIEGDELTYNIKSTPKRGLLTFNPDGTYNYTPYRNFVGVDSFSYVANDGINDSMTAKVTLTINNSQPIANDTKIRIYSNTPYTGNCNITDPDNDALYYNYVTNPSNGILKLKSDGNYVYTPNIGFIGTDSFTYMADDGINNSNIANVTIDVINNPPVANNQTIYTNLNTQYNGKLNVIDKENDELMYDIINPTSNGALSLSPDGSYVYIPHNGFAGVDNFSYIVSDGVDKSNITYVTISVINTTPIANNQNISTPKNTQHYGKLNATKKENNELNYNYLTYPSNGSLSTNPDGSYVYSPHNGFVGVDSFNYEVRGDNETSDIACVTINVFDCPPVASDQNVTIPRNIHYNGNLNVTDVDNSDLNCRCIKFPSNGSVTINPNGSYVYYPRNGFIGVDSFSYIANDGIYDSNIANETLNVVNNPPVAHDVNFDVKVSTLWGGGFSGKLNGTDINGDVLTYKLLNKPGYAEDLILNENGDFQYITGIVYYQDEEYCTYQVNDGIDDSNIGKIRIICNTM